MRRSSILPSLLAVLSTARPSTTNQNALLADHSTVSLTLFAELEELARIVDIAYCVGTTGIAKPFVCASRCTDFPTFELVETFNTGPLMSDSCGYIALDHGVGRLGRETGRLLVVFRGTYSIADTIMDLSTVPQEYVPYPGRSEDGNDPPAGRERGRGSWLDWVPWGSRFGVRRGDVEVEEEGGGERECANCTVHTGFWTSWQNIRDLILPRLASLRKQYPDYRLHLVGHSLGGAVAGLAALEFDALGFEPVVTTFGEPKIGNAGLRDFIDTTFDLQKEEEVVKSGRYRRVTHVDDPVPLLPLQEWGYRAHAGEHFISKPDLQPTLADVRLCDGDEDESCIASSEVVGGWSVPFPIPGRYKMWQLFFAHRDYFWRLGLCVPGGDPLNWGRGKNRFREGDAEEEEAREEL